ncbi:hypothetical protein GCM10007052_16840 [Halioglobus japonicus]|nr:hypothetical protein GCM10007052_16840 [Halioglobus japonicus]
MVGAGILYASRPTGGGGNEATSKGDSILRFINALQNGVKCGGKLGIQASRLDGGKS